MERAPAAHSSKKRAKRGPPLAIAQLDAPGKQGAESIGVRGGKGGASGRATKHKKGKANTRRERKAAAGRDPDRHKGEQHARTHDLSVSGDEGRWLAERHCHAGRVCLVGRHHVAAQPQDQFAGIGLAGTGPGTQAAVQTDIFVFDHDTA